MNKEEYPRRVPSCEEHDPSLQYAWRIIGSLANRLKYLEQFYLLKRRGDMSQLLFLHSFPSICLISHYTVFFFQVQTMT